MKDAVVTIIREDSDKFKGQSKGSAGWFNFDIESLKRKFSALEPDFYKNLYEEDIEDHDMELYETVFAIS